MSERPQSLEVWAAIGSRLFRRLLMAGAVMLLGVSCSGEVTTPTFDSVPPPTVPSDWATFSDETKGFQISYPSNWVPGATDEALANEFLESVGEGTVEDLEFVQVLSRGFAPQGGLFDPSLTVDVEALPFDVPTDDYAQAKNQNIESDFPSHELIQETRVRAGDHAAVLLHESFDLSDFDPSLEGRVWLMTQYVSNDKLGWVATCSTHAPTASDTEANIANCEAVVRSFKLITP